MNWIKNKIVKIYDKAIGSTYITFCDLTSSLYEASKYLSREVIQMNEKFKYDEIRMLYEAYKYFDINGVRIMSHDAYFSLINNAFIKKEHVKTIYPVADQACICYEIFNEPTHVVVSYSNSPNLKLHVMDKIYLRPLWGENKHYLIPLYFKGSIFYQLCNI